MDKCPFCGSKKVKEMSSSSGLHELFDCHNIFVQGKLYYKRLINCYETELSHLKELVREMVEVFAEIKRAHWTEILKKLGACSNAVERSKGYYPTMQKNSDKCSSHEEGLASFYWAFFHQRQLEPDNLIQLIRIKQIDNILSRPEVKAIMEDK